MPHPVELFFKAVQEQVLEKPDVFWIGSSWSDQCAPELKERGWRLQFWDSQRRLEFISLKREQFDGIVVEELPSGFSHESTQRLFAAFFQGLKPGGLAFIGLRNADLVPVLAWLRQSGFEALQQGSSGEIQGVLARRIGVRAH